MKKKHKNIIKKIILILVSLIIFLPLGNSTLADNNINIVNEYYENPIYQGLKINSKTTEYASLSYEAPTFNSLEEARKYLCQQMVKRESNINFKVNTSYYKGIHLDIYKMAVDDKNASNPNEGDYINSHMTSYNVKMSYTSTYVKFEYKVNYLTSYEEELLVDKKVKQVLDQLDVYNASEYEKIKAVHDYIVKNINYDYSLKNHSSYNAIVDKNVVCQGFSSLTYRMLKELGVDVRYISGYSNGERHAWNIVKINNKWYNIDNTWDENLSNGSISYKYFLKSMSDFTNHERDSEFTTNEFNKSYPMSSSNYSTSNSSKNSTYTRTLTKDIYKYDIGKNKYLTSINGKGYSQYSYLNKSGKYAFTPSSWMVAAGLEITMPTSSNGYTMTINNKYKTLYEEAQKLLYNTKNYSLSSEEVYNSLYELQSLENETIEEDYYINIDEIASIKRTLTTDIYKYDAGKGNYLTYINGKGYSQYVYLNKSGKYAFTPSSWMKAAGLEVTMPTSSNGYTMKISNPYKTKYESLVKEIQKNI